MNFAASRGHAQPTVKDQLDFYVYEGTSGQDEGAKKAFELASQAQSPEEAAQIIMTHFERPSGDPRENQTRSQTTYRSTDIRVRGRIRWWTATTTANDYAT